MMKVSDYIALRLKNIHKISDVFMVSGGGAMHLNDSFGRYLNYICNHNEQASGLCGEGYGRVNQKPCVVNVTTGPGGLNALNGVFGSWTDSVPVIFISGQVKFSTTIASCPELALRQLGDQEVDIISVVKPLTKYAEMITDPQKVKYCLDKAVYLATHGRFGPVWLDIPHNVQSAMIDENDLIDFIPPAENKPELKIAEVIAKLQQAQRPLLVAGHGIRLSGQIENFQKLLEKLNIPAVTTFNGFDILEDDNPNYVGRIGTIGQRAGNFVLQNADCVLFLGTRNNIRQASYNWENFAKNAYKIAVDIDNAELQKPTVRPDLTVNADLADFIPALLEKTPELNTLKWLEYGQNLRRKYDFTHTPEYQHKDGKINAYAAIKSICDANEENDLCVMANATATICTFQLAGIKKGQRFFSNSGDASMGYDLPAAIGACVAADRRKTICLAGDGSIMMNLQELQTIKHNNLPIKIFIINNDGYISIKQTQNNFFEGRHCGDGRNSGVSLPDFVKIGTAFGIKSLRVDKPENLDKAIAETLEGNEPVICEVMVNPDYVFTPKLSARVLPDGSMESPSLEDMFPFLPREEFAENMICCKENKK